jgi:putative aldouronate transport system substrate-binding protein
MNKLLKRSIVIGLSMAMLAAAGCTTKNKDDGKSSGTGGNPQVTEKPDPYSKMPQLVEFTTGRSLPAETKLPQGETIENNDVAKWCEENLNVRAKVVWTTSDQNNAYENKLNLLIASNDIPDAFVINTEPYGFNILRKLIDNDMIQDLTEVFDKYASPTLKEFHGKSNNVALKEVTFNGKLMAIPGLADTETALPIVWLRKDWLDKLGLKEPKTVDDVADIAKAFQENDPDGNNVKDTVGLPASSRMFKGDTATFDFVFGAFNSYPGDWVEDKNGNVVYGSITPETKAALAKLQEMYKMGILDKEFALKDSDKAIEPIKANKAGIFQGAWWSTWWPIQDSVKNDSNAQWKAYFIGSDDGKYYGRSYPVVRNFIVVKKGFKHPEAIMKAVNWYEDAGLKKVDWYNQLIAKEGKYNTTAVGLWPVNGGSAKYLDEISRRYKAIMEVVDGKVAKDAADPETAFLAEQMLAEKAEPMKDIGVWCNANSWILGASLFEKHKIEQKFPAFSGSTESMTKKKAILEDLEQKTFMSIIMDKAPIDEFDKFVERWKALGGEEITKEIQGIVKK